MKLNQFLPPLPECRPHPGYPRVNAGAHESREP
jgi:hypothetical protein